MSRLFKIISPSLDIIVILHTFKVSIKNADICEGGISSNSHYKTHALAK